MLILQNQIYFLKEKYLMILHVCCIGLYALLMSWYMIANYTTQRKLKVVLFNIGYNVNIGTYDFMHVVEYCYNKQDLKIWFLNPTNFTWNINNN